MTSPEKQKDIEDKKQLPRRDDESVSLNYDAGDALDDLSEELDPNRDQTDVTPVIELDPDDGLAANTDVVLVRVLPEINEYLSPNIEDEALRYLKYKMDLDDGGVPELKLEHVWAIIGIESGGKMIVNSSLDVDDETRKTGWYAHGEKYSLAAGMGQIMPQTGRAMGLRVMYKKEELNGARRGIDLKPLVGVGKLEMKEHTYSIDKDGFFIEENGKYFDQTNYRFPVIDERMDLYRSLDACLMYLRKLYESAKSKYTSEEMRLADVAHSYNSGRGITNMRLSWAELQASGYVIKFRRHLSSARTHIQNKTTMLEHAYDVPEEVQVVYEKGIEGRYQPLTFREITDPANGIISLFELLDLNGGLRLRVPITGLVSNGTIKLPAKIASKAKRRFGTRFWTAATYSDDGSGNYYLEAHTLDDQQISSHHAARRVREGADKVGHERNDEYELFLYDNMWDVTFQDLVDLGALPSEILKMNPNLNIAPMLDLAIPEGYDLRLPVGKSDKYREFMRNRGTSLPEDRQKIMQFHDIENRAYQFFAEVMFDTKADDVEDKIEGLRKEIEKNSPKDYKKIELWQVLNLIEGKGIGLKESLSVSSLYSLLEDNPDILQKLFAFLDKKFEKSLQSISGNSRFTLEDVRYFFMMLDFYKQYAIPQNMAGEENIEKVIKMRATYETIQKWSEQNMAIRAQALEVFKTNPPLYARLMAPIGNPDKVKDIDDILKKGEYKQMLDDLFYEAVTKNLEKDETVVEAERALRQQLTSIQAVAPMINFQFDKIEYGYEEIFNADDELVSTRVDTDFAVVPIAHSGNVIGFIEFQLGDRAEGGQITYNIYFKSQVNVGAKLYDKVAMPEHDDDYNVDLTEVTVGNIFEAFEYYYNFELFGYDSFERAQNIEAPIDGTDYKMFFDLEELTAGVVPLTMEIDLSREFPWEYSVAQIYMDPDDLKIYLVIINPQKPDEYKEEKFDSVEDLLSYIREHDIKY